MCEVTNGSSALLEASSRAQPEVRSTMSSYDRRSKVTAEWCSQPAATVPTDIHQRCAPDPGHITSALLARLAEGSTGGCCSDSRPLWRMSETAAVQTTVKWTADRATHLLPLKGAGFLAPARDPLADRGPVKAALQSPPDILGSPPSL